MTTNDSTPETPAIVENNSLPPSTVPAPSGDPPADNGENRPELPTAFTFPRASAESPRAYSAFMAYFQLGHARSLPTLAGKLDESLDTLKKWSSKFDWAERIQSFNAGLLQQQAETEAAAPLLRSSLGGNSRGPRAGHRSCRRRSLTSGVSSIPCSGPLHGWVILGSVSCLWFASDFHDHRFPATSGMWVP
jgi:hypothetical protein